jgi:hypothetical protein
MLDNIRGKNIKDIEWKNPRYREVKWKIFGVLFILMLLFLGSIVLHEYVHEIFLYPAMFFLILVMFPTYWIYVFKLRIPKKIIIRSDRIFIENLDTNGIRASFEEIRSIERPNENQIMIRLNRFQYLSRNLRLHYVDDTCYDEIMTRYRAYRKR